MKLVLLGINHKTAPVEVRERLAIPASRLADATRTLLHHPGVREGMILSTCNRVELLTSQEGGEESQPANLLAFLHQYFALPPAIVEPHLYEYREREAVRHLFRVASSLDSMVVGEPQILGQVKSAYTVAREVGAVQGELDGLLQRTFAVAKKVRHETQIGASSVSIASVAVELARKIFGSLEGKTVLLVGAGKMSELAARHLMEQGAAAVMVANRTPERAVQLATQFAAWRCCSIRSTRRPPRQTSSSRLPARPSPSSAPSMAVSSCRRARTAPCSSSTLPCRAMWTRK